MSDFPASLQEALARAEGDPRISNTQSQAMQAANRPRHRPMPRVLRSQGPIRRQGGVNEQEAHRIENPEGLTYGEEAILGTLEPTGLPSFRRGGRALAQGRGGDAAGEFALGGLGLLTMGVGPRVAARPPVAGRGLFGARAGAPRPVANDPNILPRRIPEQMQPAPYGYVKTENYPQRLWTQGNESGVNRTNFGRDGWEANDAAPRDPRLEAASRDPDTIYWTDENGELQFRAPTPEERAAGRWSENENPPPPGSTNITEPPPAPIRTPAREIGANGLPVSQRQPFRTSLRGGADDLNEAAAMRAPDEAPPAAGSGAGPQQSSLGPQRTYTFAGPRGQTYEVQVAPDERAGQAVVGFWRQRADGFAPRLRPHNDLSPGEARGVYREVARLLREDAAQYGRPSYHARGYTGRQSALYRALAEQEGGLPGYQVAAGENGALVFRRAQNKPPSSEPLASSIGGIPIPQVVRRDFQRLGENIGRFKDEVVEGAGTARLASPQQYRGFGGRAVAMGDIAKLPFDPPRAPLFGAYRHAGRLSAEPPSKVMATWALGVAPVGAGTAALLPPIRRAGEERQAENRAVYAMERMNAEDKARLNSITQARPMPYQNPGRPAWEDRRIYTMPGDLEEPNEGYAINPATGRPLPAPKFRRNKNAPAFTGAFR